MSPHIDPHHTDTYRLRSARSVELRALHRVFVADSVYLIVLLLALDGALALVRGRVGQTQGYPFIPWNLFLACVPYGVSLCAAAFHRRFPRRAWTLLPLFGLWLLFLPNAPYLLTDFIHLRDNATAQIWFDTTLLAIYALTGYMLAIVSLAIMHRLVRDIFGWRVGWAFVLASLVLAGVGIHLGRVQRYNSWDVATHPQALLEDILVPLVHPLMHPHTAFDALRYATILLVGYVAFLALRGKEARAIIVMGRDVVTGRDA